MLVFGKPCCAALTGLELLTDLPVWMDALRGQRMTGFSGAGVTGDCELHNMGTGN